MNSLTGGAEQRLDWQLAVLSVWVGGDSCLSGNRVGSSALTTAACELLEGGSLTWGCGYRWVCSIPWCFRNVCRRRGAPTPPSCCIPPLWFRLERQFLVLPLVHSSGMLPLTLFSICPFKPSPLPFSTTALTPPTFPDLLLPELRCLVGIHPLEPGLHVSQC